MSAETNPPGRDQSPEEGDWIARQFFSSEDLQMAPEEYAARHAHLWGCFSLHRYRYVDSGLENWIHRLADILRSSEEIERCRQRFLTSEELATVQRKEAGEF